MLKLKKLSSQSLGRLAYAGYFAYTFTFIFIIMRVNSLELSNVESGFFIASALLLQCAFPLLSNLRDLARTKANFDLDHLIIEGEVGELRHRILNQHGLELISTVRIELPNRHDIAMPLLDAAIHSNQLEVFKCLLENHVHPHEDRAQDGYTTLQRAAIQPNSVYMRLLLSLDDFNPLADGLLLGSVPNYRAVLNTEWIQADIPWGEYVPDVHFSALSAAACKAACFENVKLLSEVDNRPQSVLRAFTAATRNNHFRILNFLVLHHEAALEQVASLVTGQRTLKLFDAGASQLQKCRSNLLENTLREFNVFDESKLINLVEEYARFAFFKADPTRSIEVKSSSKNNEQIESESFEHTIEIKHAISS